ncbi:DUF3575 domain-containing protein [Dysgonomonas sp. ZJ709]|uniref:DUF3575 domain-containing protein n=1 Tax=Dysgonomonas sp. ZJ709 TaxID=2709797 RepID=UPI0013EBF7B1|nr:DUF3575 domain-containing protein [Dysgonomonas sp. ZJ709]
MKRTVVLKYILLLLLCLSTSGLRAQFYSLGTNIPALGTTTLNLEASMTLNRKWSVHLPVYYNPFVFKDNKKIQNFSVLPGVRYWMLESYVRGFVGVNAIGSKYHFTWKDYRYEGLAFGGGISAGYAYLLSPRWNLEVQGGIGLIWADYTKYKCEECGKKLADENGWYLIPNQIAISLIYLF